VSEIERFHDLLFEVSNKYRHRILLLIQKKAMRVTDMTEKLNLTYPEIRRHISRLMDTGLIERDLDGYYSLTPYGDASLLLFQELIFLSTNREYFLTHTLSKIPDEFVKRVGELGASVCLANPMEFFRYTENLVIESNEYVWLLVDQFPLYSLSTIVEAIDRGVKIRIIEPVERTLNPDLDAMTSEETQAFNRTRHTPMTEQRMVEWVNAYLIVSDTRCILALPTADGQYDFKGFAATDEPSLNWCRRLFLHYWGKAEQRTTAPETKVTRGRVSRGLEPSEHIVVVGQERPEIDAQAVQDAVDNYDEVILRGAFNFGSSSVLISKNVFVRGEGRENGIPKATLFKKGWKFPFTEWDCVFKVDGEGADVTIENMNFTDFNHTCIWGVRCNSLNIKDNRITLTTGYGRGMSFGAFGDAVVGINVWPEPGIFRGRVSIEGNYIDFARRGAFGGFLTRGGLEEAPEYRPDLFNHEYYMGFGVAVQQASGSVSIKNNIVRNMNARGIAVTGCLPSADVQIRHNTVISDIYGSYPFSSREAGVGILAQSAWGFPSPGFDVEIEENKVELDRLNYSGIIALGPVMDREGAGKLKGGSIRENHIRLKEGYEGIHVRKCDEFEVTGNVISGEVYYGIRISGRRSRTHDHRALNNLVEGNDMSALRIKDPDKYSHSHVNGRRFAGKQGKSATANIWLNAFSKENVIRVKEDETVIDEGEDNKIINVGD